MDNDDRLQVQSASANNPRSSQKPSAETQLDDTRGGTGHLANRFWRDLVEEVRFWFPAWPGPARPTFQSPPWVTSNYRSTSYTMLHAPSRELMLTPIGNCPIESLTAARSQVRVSQVVLSESVLVSRGLLPPLSLGRYHSATSPQSINNYVRSTFSRSIRLLKYFTASHWQTT